ncbi:DUF2069 domain-containing protein [Candidatus Woesearchaeota archaeon]|nr:DUF2069 domain-containing protein [Candidatus Woesearchaeota archaeon]
MSSGLRGLFLQSLPLLLLLPGVLRSRLLTTQRACSLSSLFVSLTGQTAVMGLTFWRCAGSVALRTAPGS